MRSRRVLVCLAFLVACGGNKSSVFEDAGIDMATTDDAAIDAPDALLCPTGQTICGSPPACVDTTTDEDHCGQCGIDCGAGTCITHGGTTICCPSGETNCNGQCVDVLDDPANCGTCGTDCGTGTCQTSGSSTICCPEGQTNCSGTCRDLSTDEANCGGCAGTSNAEVCSGATDTCCGGNCVDIDLDGANCGGCAGSLGAEVCSGGTPICTPTSTTGDATCCADGQTNCGGACVDPVADNNNCGGCDITCTNTDVCQVPDTGSTAGGPTCCDSTTENNCNGQCSDPMTDINNCGGCGIECTGSDSCIQGLCCGPGEIKCGTVCVNPDTNQDHCGGCAGAGGTDCPVDSPFCSDGTCGASCDSGETECSGACVDIESDPDHCGGCAGAGGVVCTSSEVCNGGTCSTTCSNTLCGGNCVDPQTDENNCGGCADAGGSVCGAFDTCDGGLCCAPGSVKNGTICCPIGWLNCGGVCKAPNSDDTCGTTCQAMTDCGTGTCTSGTGGTFCCAAGTARCGDQCADLTESETHCGACFAGCTGSDQCTESSPPSAGTPECCDPNTELNCGGDTCIDKIENDQNCGMCGNDCTTSGEQCSLGECCPQGFTNIIVGANSICCGPGQISCDGMTCLDLNANGSCGTTSDTCDTLEVCDSGTICANGNCEVNCGTLTNCNGSCVNRATDTNHCGACGNICPAQGQACTDPDMNGLGTCQPCPDVGPNPDPDDGCSGVCVDTDANNNHCGGCSTSGDDRSCDVGESCSDGLCCPLGWFNCGGVCKDPTSTTTCGTTCDAMVDCGAGATCTNGVCGCPFNETTCPNGGCTTLSTDPNNCGACDNVCGTGTNAGKPFCVSNSCVAACPSPLVNCGGTCVHLDTDNDNCSACGAGCTADGKGCGATPGGTSGSCDVDLIPVGDPPAKCADGGPPIVVPLPGGGTECTGNIGQVSFTFGLCSRTAIGPLDHLLKTDALDSTTGAYTPGLLGGGVGANLGMRNDAITDIGGDMWLAGASGLYSQGQTTTVRQRLYNKGTITYNKDVFVLGQQLTPASATDVAYIGGGYFPLGANSKMDIDGVLTTPDCGSVPASVTPNSCNPSSFTMADPCGSAADLVPVRFIAAHFANPANNDNAAIGLPYDALDNPSGSKRLDLYCGNYYLNSINAINSVTIVAHGRVGLFIGGSIRISQRVVLHVEPTGSLDVFVGGVMDVNQITRLGSPLYPRLTRMYFGSPSCVHAEQACASNADCCSGVCRTSDNMCTGGGAVTLLKSIELDQGGSFNGLLYAGHGTFTHSNPLEMYGSIFANYFDSTNNTTIHYDKGAVQTGEECGGTQPSPGTSCESCRDCGNQACVSNTCGACTSDTQCCPPLHCDSGTCTL